MKPHVIRPEESQEYYFEEGCHILELSNSSNDPGLSIARARVAPGQATKLHQLADIVERYVILQGEGRVALSNNHFQRVVRGDVVIIPPDCPQQIQNMGETDLIFLAICTPRFIREKYTEIEMKIAESPF